MFTLVSWGLCLCLYTFLHSSPRVQSLHVKSLLGDMSMEDTPGQTQPDTVFCPRSLQLCGPLSFQLLGVGGQTLCSLAVRCLSLCSCADTHSMQPQPRTAGPYTCNRARHAARDMQLQLHTACRSNCAWHANSTAHGMQVQRRMPYMSQM